MTFLSSAFSGLQRDDLISTEIVLGLLSFTADLAITAMTHGLVSLGLVEPSGFPIPPQFWLAAPLTLGMAPSYPQPSDSPWQASQLDSQPFLGHVYTTWEPRVA